MNAIDQEAFALFYLVSTYVCTHVCPSLAWPGRRVLCICTCKSIGLLWGLAYLLFQACLTSLFKNPVVSELKTTAHAYGLSARRLANHYRKRVADPWQNLQHTEGRMLQKGLADLKICIGCLSCKPRPALRNWQCAHATTDIKLNNIAYLKHRTAGTHPADVHNIATNISPPCPCQQALGHEPAVVSSSRLHMHFGNVGSMNETKAKDLSAKWMPSSALQMEAAFKSVISARALSPTFTRCIRSHLRPAQAMSTCRILHGSCRVQRFMLATPV